MRPQVQPLLRLHALWQQRSLSYTGTRVATVAPYRAVTAARTVQRLQLVRRVALLPTSPRCRPFSRPRALHLVQPL